ncbi:hypothetical protein Daus18300_013557 [Diaporthe australafricana]|uniref:Uncharacterized protein n=1 Tax=Diaporthe australafricana TaxID=127596 RepID=A0ABR3VYW6_9PEZI
MVATPIDDESLPPHNLRDNITTVRTITRPAQSDSLLLASPIQRPPVLLANTNPNSLGLHRNEKSNKTVSPQSKSHPAAAVKRRAKQKRRNNIPAVLDVLEAIVVASIVAETAAK